MAPPKELGPIVQQLHETGLCILQDIDEVEADRIYEELPALLNASTLLHKAILKKPMHVEGFRTKQTKYFSSVDLRHPDVVILPHCEGPHGGVLRLALFYCKQPDSGGGGINVLVPTGKIPVGTRFSTRRTYEAGAVQKAVDLVFEQAGLAECASFKVVTAALVRYTMAAHTTMMRLVSGWTLGDDLQTVFEPNVEPMLAGPALNGKVYCCPGFSCTYYDKSLQEAFYRFLAARNDVPFDGAAARSVLESDQVAAARYATCYSSGFDWDPVLAESKVLQPKARQLVILDNRRWMHSATQSSHDGSRQMAACFT